MNSEPPAEGENFDNPPTILGVALDMDGLMFDTEPLYHAAANDLLGLRGHRYEDAVRRQMMGQPGPKAIQVMLDYYGLTESWEDVLEESDRIFAGYLKNELPALPGLYDLLDLLDQLKLPYGVATSSRRLFAGEILERGGVTPRLHFLMTGDDVKHGKPDPEMYLAAAAKLSIPPEQMLVLEDSGNGVMAAVIAGAQVVAVPGEHSRDHDFSGTVLVADSLADPRLLEIIRRGQ